VSYAVAAFCFPVGGLRFDDALAFSLEVAQFYDLCDFLVGDAEFDLLDAEVLRREIDDSCRQLKHKPGESVIFSIPTLSRRFQTPVSLFFNLEHRIDGRSFDLFDFTFDSKLAIPNGDLLRNLTTLLNPAEAYFTETEIRSATNAHNRQVSARRAMRFSPPVVIQRFHYICGEFVEQLGGLQKCLDAPVWKVEPFLDGVIFQLGPDLLDENPAEHIELYERVVRYFWQDILPIPEILENKSISTTK